MMKLSMETFVLCKRYSDEKAIKLMKAAGFDCVDYSFYWLDEKKEILGEEYLDHAHQVRKLLDENGMSCNQAHAPFTMRYGDPFDCSNKDYADIVRAMEAAAIMGAEHIIVHSIGVPKGEDCFAYNLKFYKSLEPYCEAFGIRVAIENLFEDDNQRRCYRGRLHTPELLKGMLAELDSPWFVICIDIGHAAITGVDPDLLIGALDGNILKALHVQDTDYLSDRHALPYTGSLDWSSITAALKRIGYSGEITLEVFGYLGRFDDTLIEDALRFAASVGKRLAEQVED